MDGQVLLNYRIIHRLGAGGQGTIYKAVDTNLDRTVVVKVLSPELTKKSVNLSRFEREARLAASLDHPNICTIYGLHEVNGVRFMVMQYVEGLNVRQFIQGQPLELRSVLMIAIQVADALAAAHARGIIHRDIKSSNVVVTASGLIKVLDFGLAKMLDEEGGIGDTPQQMELTEVGVPYGTATYAAPEQASGQRADRRSDIFSTGVLIYEMLTGTWPFHGKTSVEVRYAVIHATPRPIIEFRTDVPPRMQEILDRALAKDPRDRYQKVEHLRDDLKSVLREIDGGSSDASQLTGGITPLMPRYKSGSGSVTRNFRRWLRNVVGVEQGLTNTSATSMSTQSETHKLPQVSQSETAPKSIAVLPFHNLSNDPAVSFYELMLADAVITELAKMRSLIVRPSSLIAKYQGQQRDPREMGQELSVNTILSASFLKADERLRITIQLLDVASGAILWSDRIDAAADDTLALQDTIVRRIVEGMSPVL